MGKRTAHVTGRTHAPRARDYWPTIDPKARGPLIPHLPRGVRYAEPMAGAGHLIKLLGPEIECAWASDLEPQVDWIAQRDVFDCELGDAQMFITNPIWTRKLLHKVVVHLSDQAPTWLLVDSDWANTDQFGRFATRCRRIVYVGRLIWIPGTTNPGFTSCSWYLFDKPIPRSAPTFYAKGQLPTHPYKPATPRRPVTPHHLLNWTLEDA
jgi:hypothetical protein